MRQSAQNRLEFNTKLSLRGGEQKKYTHLPDCVGGRWDAMKSENYPCWHLANRDKIESGENIGVQSGWIKVRPSGQNEGQRGELFVIQYY